MIWRIVAVLVLIPCCVSGGQLPDWSEARKVMKSCYGGWNGTIEVTAGLGSRFTRYNYSNFDETLSYGGKNEFKDTDWSGLSDGVASSTASSEAAYDLWENSESSIGEKQHDQLRNEAFAGLTITVPIYSRAVRLERKEKTNEQVEHLSDLYAQFEGHRATAAALQEEAKLMRKVMVEDGYQTIREYYELLAGIEKSKALANGAKRKVMTILEGCGYVGRNRTAGKRSASK